MNPVRIEGATIALGAPDVWDEEQHGRCSTLWVRSEVDGGLPFLRSAWEVSPSEVGLLLAGAKVHLGVCAKAHPVVNLGLGPIPEDFEPPLIVERTVHHGAAAIRVSMFFPNAQRVWAEAYVGPDGLGAAVKLAVDQVEERAKQEGWL